MPTSVLLAVLAAAGLLALAPALVRRYDATERLVAERASSTARVLQRRRRRRSVPGRHPVNTPRAFVVAHRDVGFESRQESDTKSPSSVRDAASASPPPGSALPASVSPRSAPPRSTSSLALRSGRRLRSAPVDARAAATLRRREQRYAPAIYRRRRIFAGLIALNLVELTGVVLAGPGFWSGFSVTALLLAGYVVRLRGLAIADRRRRRAQAREAAWLAARQAEVRREQARRAAARREMQRRLAEQREAVRRAAQGYRPPHAAAAVGGGGVTSASYSYRRGGGVRGRPYRAGRSSGAHPA